jgi:adenylylsulfate kinase
VAVSLISPYIKNREAARKIIGSDRFVEVYVRCSLNTCEKRDVKGMYKKARDGKIENFTGIQDPYEEPLNPEIVVNTEEEGLEITVDKIIARLTEMNHLSDNTPSKPMEIKHG